MKEDKLKDIFQEAFDAEHVAFDPSDWNAFEAALNERRRRRAFYYLTRGLAGLIVVGTFWVFWPDDNTLYVPRNLEHAIQFNRLERPTAHTTVPANQMIATAPSPNQEERSHYVEHRDEAAPAHSRVSNDAAVPSPAAQPPLPTAPTPPNLGSDAAASDIGAAEKHGGLEQASPITQTDMDHHAQDFDRNLALMPLRTAALSQPEKDVETRTDEYTAHLARRWKCYVRLGAAFGPAGKLGQVGGIGMTKQLAERLLLSGELNGSRDLVDFSSQRSSVVYGYEKYDHTLQVNATEMLSVRMPIMARLRYNRVTFGAGLSGQYVFATKLQEVANVSSPSQSIHERVSHTNDVGYVRWDAMRSFNVGLLGDVQYQLNESYFIGGRGAVPLRDAFLTNDGIDRPYRVEVYLKMRIKP